MLVRRSTTRPHCRANRHPKALIRARTHSRLLPLVLLRCSSAHCYCYTILFPSFLLYLQWVQKPILLSKELHIKVNCGMPVVPSCATVVVWYIV
ncbi:hypothetical protein GQ54DRAFT_197635 [Martensiomyces pterosporus]|nr:hypothetical protein GQ54DRAFT_197635 [Martensiomyces pterosporus]